MKKDYRPAIYLDEKEKNDLKLAALLSKAKNINEFCRSAILGAVKKIKEKNGFK